MIKVDTKTLEVHFAHSDPTEWINNIPLIQAYHTSRMADAMERIASHIENNQISVLEGTDIANALDRIARNK